VVPRILGSVRAGKEVYHLDFISARHAAAAAVAAPEKVSKNSSSTARFPQEGAKPEPEEESPSFAAKEDSQVRGSI
jgi:hypothetical protein